MIHPPSGRRGPDGTASTARHETSRSDGATIPIWKPNRRYIDRAYGCLDDPRVSANRLRSMVEVGAGRHRAGPLRARGHLGHDRQPARPAPPGRRVAGASAASTSSRPTATAPPTFYIGRLAVSDETQEPVVVDWRAPVAEPFYRATGREPMGLARRRHFASRGPHAARHRGRAVRRRAVAARPRRRGRADAASRGYGALIAALETARTGRLGDIVATIQAEQDEIIRCRAAGRARRAGRPGHRQDRGGPAPRRLPALHPPLPARGPGRAGGRAQPAVPALHRAGAAVARRGRRRAGRARRPRSTTVSVSGVDDRGRRRPRQGRPAHGRGARQRGARPRAPAARRRCVVRLRAPDPARSTSPQSRPHRARRAPPLPHATTPAGGSSSARLLEALAASSRDADRPPTRSRDRLRTPPEVREALEWMWPVLTPGRAAARPVRLARRCCGSPAGAMLRDDECRVAAPAPVGDRRRRGVDRTTTCRCSTRPARCSARCPGAKARRAPTAARRDEVRTYGHIVVDEAQDLSPMQLRMLTRRSLNGSMTDRRRHRPGDRRVGPRRLARGARPPARPAPAARRAELTVGYRIPAPIWPWPPGCWPRSRPTWRRPGRCARTATSPAVLVRAEPGRLGRDGRRRRCTPRSRRWATATWR